MPINPMPSAPSPSPRDRRGRRRTPCSTPSASARAPTSWPSPPRTPPASTQQVLPTFAVVARLRARRARWASIGTFNPAMLVHGEQAIELHQPIPVEGTVARVTTKITGIYDKGKAARRRDRGDGGRREDGEPLLHDTYCRPSSAARAAGAATVARRGRATCRPSARPTTRSPTRRRPTRRSSTGCRVTATRCTPIRRSRRWAASTADPPRAVHLRVHRSGAAAHAVRRRSRPGSGRWRAGSRRRCFPGDALTVDDLGDRRRRGGLPDDEHDGTVVIDQGGCATRLTSSRSAAPQRPMGDVQAPSAEARVRRA